MINYGARERLRDFGGSLDGVSAGAMRTTIFTCFGSVVDSRGCRLSPDLDPNVPGERPFDVREDSGSLKRFSDETDGSWSFIITVGRGWTQWSRFRRVAWLLNSYRQKQAETQQIKNYGK
jgi:hypothetical protein